MSYPTIVCVLGMHRSGTSLLTRALNLLGVDLGPDEHLMRPGPANPTGHWESLPMKEINDEILRRFGGSWSEPPELADGWERSPELAEPRRQARSLIQADFSRSRVWGFKDPRNCLTLPFWQRILTPMHYVLCLRNPIDVAASLGAREDESIPFEQGIALWLTYVRAALDATAGHQRVLVFYEDLMAHPEPVIGRLVRFIGRQGKDAPDPQTRAAISAAVSEGLWHHRTPVPNVVDVTELGFHVKALYLVLRLFVPRAQSIGSEVLDLFGAYADEAGRDLAELDATRMELEEVREQASILERERAALEGELSARSSELKRIAHSHAEEQRLRHELEAELQAEGADVSSQPEPVRAERASDARPPEYERLLAEIRARAEDVIPPGATVLVASKGDDALLRLNGSQGLHFPSAAEGRYAGHHPAGDTAVIAHLEALRARGADHLLLPATMLWWLDHYAGLRHHLEERYERLYDGEDCVVYRLGGRDQRRSQRPLATLKDAVACLRMRSGRDPSILDWHTGLNLADQLPELLVFGPPGEAQATLPYLDSSVDVVVLASENEAQTAEAHRVAASAVIRVDPDVPEVAELEWLAGESGSWGEDVSVTLIPGADHASWDATITALAETLTGGFAGEFAVVGDAATLGRTSERAAAAGIEARAIETSTGTSLTERARAATKAGRRPLHVFVTAPAAPLPDWLPSMLALFSPGRDAGVVGTRILSPYGSLAEAGGVVAADGSRQRRGKGDFDPDRPEYGFVRRVDFCSPPLLATRRDLFERLRGFDQRQGAPAAAVIDFTLRAGRTGRPVYYQPGARVVALGDGS